MIREFIVLPSFLMKWKHLQLDESDMRRLEQDLLANPKVGAVIRGTGGIRKMRFAYQDKGKSGSLRIIYVDFEIYEKIYLVDVYQKADKDNLTQEERNNMKQIVELIELSLEQNDNSRG